MSIPALQKIRVGAYLTRQHLAGRKRYPLVLMLEPLFRCNLACAGCGKIDYPDEILNQRISVADALQAVVNSYEEARKWAKAHPDELAALLASRHVQNAATAFARAQDEADQAAD